jgi:hypothetical protein
MLHWGRFSEFFLFSCHSTASSFCSHLDSEGWYIPQQMTYRLNNMTADQSCSNTMHDYICTFRFIFLVCPLDLPWWSHHLRMTVPLFSRRPELPSMYGVVYVAAPKLIHNNCKYVVVVSYNLFLITSFHYFVRNSRIVLLNLRCSGRWPKNTVSWVVTTYLRTTQRFNPEYRTFQCLSYHMCVRICVGPCTSTTSKNVLAQWVIFVICEYVLEAFESSRELSRVRGLRHW